MSTNSSGSRFEQLCVRLNDVRHRFSRTSPAELQSDQNDLRHAQWNWFQILHYYFLNGEQQQQQNLPANNDADDLLYFVRRARRRGDGLWSGERGKPQIEVYRRNSPLTPTPEDDEIDFEETVYLNVILHCLEYTATVCICSRTSPSDIQIIKRLSMKLFATVHKPQHLQGLKSIDKQNELKSASALISYPEIYFPVEEFENIFPDFYIRDSESICVELVASVVATHETTTSTTTTPPPITVLFQGSVRYEALKQAIVSRQAMSNSTAAGYAASSTLGRRMLRTSAASRFSHLLNTAAGGNNSNIIYDADNKIGGEVIKMKGPSGKGLAEVCVLQQKTFSRPSTPSNNYDGDDDAETAGSSSSSNFRLRQARRQSELTNNYGCNANYLPGPTTNRMQQQQQQQHAAVNHRPSSQQAWYAGSSSSRPMQQQFQNNQSDQQQDAAGMRRCQSEAGLPEDNDWETVEAVTFQNDVAADQLAAPWSFRGFNQAWHWFREKRRENSVALRTQLMCVKLPWTSIINDILDERTAPVLTL